MRFVIINNLIRAGKRLRPRIELRGPADSNQAPQRRDRTGLILFLVSIAILVSVLVWA